LGAQWPRAEELRKLGVVKSATSGTTSPEQAADEPTRDRVVQLLVDGPATAAELAQRLGLGSAAIRRHLDALLAEGRIEPRTRRATTRRGRGRPARAFALTDRGRAVLGHTYDDLATAALRYLVRSGGEQALAEFVDERTSVLERRCQDAMDGAGSDPMARAAALAAVLSEEGYAASASALAHGGQLCQHHCPVAHVAAEFPQLCDAETRVIGRLVGSHVQRLATIAHGDGVCTTYIPTGIHRDPPHSTSSQPESSRPESSRPESSRPESSQPESLSTPHPRSGRTYR
jgi:predicted ArsR family transcriptional regulator